MILYKFKETLRPKLAYVRASRWVIEIIDWSFGIALSYQFNSREESNKWISDHSNQYVISIGLPLKIGFDHFYYDGPHCSLHLGFLHFRWFSDFCKKCM